MAGPHPVDISRDGDDAVAIMAGEIGVGAVAHDDFGFGRGRAGGDQQGLADFTEAGGWDFGHGKSPSGAFALTSHARQRRARCVDGHWSAPLRAVNHKPTPLETRQ